MYKILPIIFALSLLACGQINLGEEGGATYKQTQDPPPLKEKDQNSLKIGDCFRTNFPLSYPVAVSKTQITFQVCKVNQIEPEWIGAKCSTEYKISSWQHGVVIHDEKFVVRDEPYIFDTIECPINKGL